MPKAENVRNICLHCSAGFGNVESIQNYWRNTLGWRSPGYHILIDLEGEPHQLADFELQTNGVLGYNDETIHICYIGGVELVNGVYIAKDTRTNDQKATLHLAIQKAIKWLGENGKDITSNLGLVGHRDYSKDQNANGVIESWERIKECPSFEVIRSDYHYLYSSPDRYGKLPYEE